MKLRNFWQKWKKYIIGISLMLLALAVGITVGLFLLPPKEPAPQTEEQAPATLTETAEDSSLTTEGEPGTEGDTLSRTPLLKGIDVSKWQGEPDWQRVAASGVEFAMIRIGYRGESGGMRLDETADHNLQNADQNGILTGVYFYSLAKDPEDAAAEAAWVLDQVGEYAISLPIVIDYEMMENSADLTAEARTDTALAFLSAVEEAGYEGMLYAPIVEFENPELWEKERILDRFLVWGAGYDTPTYPEKVHPNQEIGYAMWQYSNTGRVDGISSDVDLNLAYFTRERSEPKKPTVSEPVIDPSIDSDPITEPPTAPVKEFNQTFTPANRRVTAKIEVNLRKTPSIEGELVGTLKNGEYLLCTGDSDMGWSRLDYNGERVFAVTTYLINEDGGSTVPTQKFQTVSQLVTAKETVNLRREPSTDAEIAGTLENGTYLTRTGIGDKGWSRLEYNGETVYAVTSYLSEKQG